MKKLFVTLAIYIIFVFGGGFIFSGVGMIAGQMSGCLSYNLNHSFLAEWLNVTYFEEKERYENCIKRPNTYEFIYDSGEKISFSKSKEEQEFSCKYAIAVPAVCGTPNYKPGMIYGILGILIFYLGIKLRKKYILPNS